MSSFHKSQRSGTNRLQLPGLITQLSPVEQLPFPENPALPGKTADQLDSSPGVTDALPQSALSPGATRPLARLHAPPGITRPLSGITRILPDVHTGPLPSSGTTTALRQPIVIRGNGKKTPKTIHPPKGRRWVISISVTILLLVITVGTAFAVAPLGRENGHGFNPFQLVINLVRNNNNNPNLVAQEATQTAITHQDGYDPSSGTTWQPGAGGPYRFAFGQCTYWANMRYHQLAGYWVPWLGNAYQWLYGAGSAGWIVSKTPHVPSIIVLQPYVEGAGPYGHVAIVEKINPDGSVYTSNYNWYANGGWDILSYWTFTPGPGVTFVWHP